MKTMELKAYGETYKLHTVIDRYQSTNNIYIGLVCDNGEPFADLTTNIMPLPDNMSAVDTNNCSWAEDLIEDYELGTKKKTTLSSGFCTYPLYEFDMNKVKEYLM